ncbi:hypothetical protein AWC38_SpisGene7008 [Stylophora pistillata]|uniref:Alkylated DNA repair protein AlkB homologue 8 N-terminal domain-containing protein n=1 Tax=Stylophora pistillata TaxID=50429 RepID=A0A2B4SC87_STYPI|nr:hypothetical protein AWC38_SpisGene7008 [Stylophora pistillata]
MVNELTPTSSFWKYFDDLTIAEVLPQEGSSTIQTTLDDISTWCSSNYLKLNPKKCKELRICFLRNPPTLLQLTNYNTSIEVVESHKLLGVLIQDDLKWHSHILSITKKAAQRLYILRVLRRNGLPPKDLLSVYTALIPSVLEYACPLQRKNLPLDNDVYDALYSILTGEKSLQDWPKQGDRGLRQRVYRSSTYSPQTQGKDECSNRMWKEKIKFDLTNNVDLNWVEYLQHYQQLYNESPHHCFGLVSPFEVYFGRKPNRYLKKLFHGGKKEYEVPEENNNSFQMDEHKREELTELERERDSIRQKALNSSNEAAQYMVKRELKRNPPSLYNKGETLLIPVPVSKKFVKGKKNSLKSTCEEFNHEADHSMHKYFICYNDPVTLKSKKGWFKVDDVTSLTKEEENERQERAKSDSSKQNTTCIDQEDSPC